jgi:membrane protein YfhO
MMAEPDVERRVAPTDWRELAASAASERSLRSHVVHVAIIVVAIVALFWRVFFLGETLVDVNTLNNQLPWGYSAGQSDYAYNRRDLTDTYVTRDYFVVGSYRDGEFPLWNPYTMAGHPIYADGVTRTLSPFLLFYRFLDVPLGYSVARITELICAAVFMYIFLVEIGASGSGALMGSLVLGLSAHSMLHLTGLGWWGGLMWLPAIVLFADRAIKRHSYVQAMLAGVCLAAQFFCGYLPNQIYYVGAVVFYYSFFTFIARRREREHREVPRILALMLVTLIVGLALSATQWVPSLELLSYSNRKIVGSELGYVYLPPWYSATLVFPNLFGAAYDAKMLTLFTALGVSHDHILYLGIAALAPIGFCLYWLKLTRRRRGDGETRARESGATRNRAVCFAWLAAISLVIMMAAPLYVPVTRYIPILQVIRVAVRAGVLFLFASAVLAALGTDLLLQPAPDLLKRFVTAGRRFAIAITTFVVLAIVGAYAAKLTGFAVDTVEKGRLAFIRRAALALSAEFTPPNLSILISLVLIFATVFLLWALSERQLATRSILISMVALLLIDLAWNSSQFDHTFDRSRVYPNTEITDLLHTVPPGRVLVVPSDLETNRSASAGSRSEKIIAPPNTLLPYQISTVTGKNQQFPGWYREYASLIEPQPNLSHVVFDQYRSPYFDLLNVRYVLTHESAPRLIGCDLVATAEGVSLYENKNAMPRAFFAAQVIEASNSPASLDVLRHPGFDPRTTAVIETTDHPALDKTAFDSQTSNSAVIVEDKRNRVVVETTNTQDGLLVLSDNYYPGWRATVDGARAEVLRANHTMRAVKVPVGHHMVSFVFMPASFFTSVYISIAVAVLILLALIVAALKRRRSISHDIR